MPFSRARVSEMPDQLPRKLIYFGALEIEKFLTSETENRRTEDDRYVDALAIEDISVHRKVSYFPFAFSPSSTRRQSARKPTRRGAHASTLSPRWGIVKSARRYLAFLVLAFLAVTGGPAASRASRSTLSRSRLAENAFCAIARSVIAFPASTWRNALRASRSALVIGLGGSTSPGVFVISSPSAGHASLAKFFRPFN